MLVVRPERLIDSWLGSTAQNIGGLFDATKNHDEPLVLFFDEFDAVAIQRRAAHEGAEDERNSFVNTLLQRIEQHTGFLIAATNFGKHIDQAIWRRFDIQITLELPEQFERERILARYLSPYGLPAEALHLLAEGCATASPALIRQFCENLKRQLVVGPKVGWPMQKVAVIDRLLATIHPHPDLGKPRLWSQGSSDAAIRLMPWPLPLAADVAGDADAGKIDDSSVISLLERRR